eukprot:gene27296-32968_t
MRYIIKANSSTLLLRRSLSKSSKHHHGHHPHAASAGSGDGMPTPLSLGHGLQFHEATHHVGKGPSKRPIAIVVGWMGAKPSQMKPYISYYNSQGIDTLSFACGPGHVLFPKKAMTHMQNVVQIALKKAITIGDDNTEPHTRNVIFHCFSMGGFLYGQTLRSMVDNPDKCGHIKPLIKAQIFDSPPDYHSIADGIAKSIGLSGFPEKFTAATMRAFLALTSSTSGVEHRASSAAFRANMISAPSLWYFSRADPVSRWEDCESVIRGWKEQGIDVEACTWEDSPHIQHGRRYPERYFGTLTDFLRRHQLIPGKDSH